MPRPRDAKALACEFARCYELGRSAVVHKLERRSRLPGPLPERLREIEIAILRSVNLGMTTQEIASNLNLTVGTVKWRMSQIFGKLQVRNRIQALARSRQREWL